MSVHPPSSVTSPSPSRDTDISQPWEDDNQAWWEWYVSLAENDDTPVELHDVDPLPAIELPDDQTLISELRTPYPLSEANRTFFMHNGFIKLTGVLSPGAVLRLRLELMRLLCAAFDTTLDGGTRDRFLSLELVWIDNPLMREFVLSPRIAGICAGLLDVRAVRLYHDNVLSKEPGCGRTPWHFDDHHFPLDTHDVVTAWAPAQPIPNIMGPLAFAKPLGVHELVDAIPFDKSDTSYDRRVSEVFRDNGVAMEDSPFEMGEVSFHHNLSFHTAAGNRSTQSRLVMANTFYADGARVLNAPTMVSGDWQKFMPGVGPGEVAASDLNPICWPIS